MATPEIYHSGIMDKCFNALFYNSCGLQNCGHSAIPALFKLKLAQKQYALTVTFNYTFAGKPLGNFHSFAAGNIF